MSITALFVYLVIALLCGLLGQMLAGRSVGGYVVATIVGLVGAVLGGYLAGVLDAPEPFPVEVGGTTILILWSIVGATLVTVLVSAFQRSRGKRSHA